MFKRYTVDFSKNLENSDFLKMRKKIYKLKKFEYFMFFQPGMTPLMTPAPYFNKYCALANFYSKILIFALLHEKTRLVKENYF